MSPAGQDWFLADRANRRWVSVRGRAEKPWSDARNVLLVTGDGTLSSGQAALKTVLEGGSHKVTVRALAAAEDYNGIDVVVHCYGQGSGQNDKYVNPPVGQVAVDSWRAIGMGSMSWAINQNAVEVVRPDDPLAGGTSGTFNAYLSDRLMTWNPEPPSAATVVVSRPGQPSNAVVFAYPAGVQMPGRFATARHVALGYHQEGLAAGLTDDAKAHVLAAVLWASDSESVGLAIPTGVSASAGDSQITVSWQSTFGADTYNVKRATVSGGPYTTVASGVTGTSYTNTGLSNGTTYFYVVSAAAGGVESDNSVEVSATPMVVETIAALMTSAELSMWKSRAANGPFRVSGDFSTNSPGHWSEMNAKLSLSPFQSARWSGPQELNSDGSIRVLGQTSSQTANDPPAASKRMAHDMMSAAYAAVITNNTQVAQAIVAEIGYQATRPRLDFSNNTLYPRNRRHLRDLNPMFMIAQWVLDYMYAYDICRSMGVTSATVEKWFLDCAMVTEACNRLDITSVFSGRASGNYSISSSHWAFEVKRDTYLADGSRPAYLRGMWIYNNRRSHLAGNYGFAGALLNNSYLKNEFKRYIREWVMYGNRRISTDGYHGDTNRGTSSHPQLMLMYSFRGTNSMLPAMDALARQGDTSLYDFSSSQGWSSGSIGTNQQKSMEQVLDGYIRWITGAWPAQYTGGGSGIVGNSFYRIKSRSELSGREMGHDASFLLPANYYGRGDWYNAVMRIGTPSGFTSGPHQVGGLTNGWQADWRQRFLRSPDANPYGG